MNVPIGIYSKKEDWDTILGVNWSDYLVSNLKLWWARYYSINDQGFDHFVPFGPWTNTNRVVMHQYESTSVNGTIHLVPCHIPSFDWDFKV